MSRTYSTIESGVGASPPRVADLEAQNLALQVLVRVIANQVLEQESKLQTTHQGKGSLTQVGAQTVIPSLVAPLKRRESLGARGIPKWF